VQVDPEKPSQPLVGRDDNTPAKPLPRCPKCGWQNVRLAHTKNVLDAVLSPISIHRFKCRSCGRYFRRRYRIAE
jgi:hypothetical protein